MTLTVVMPCANEPASTREHVRRFGTAGLQPLVTDCGFEVSKSRCLNRLGVAGWRLNSRPLTRHVRPGDQLAARR